MQPKPVLILMGLTLTTAAMQSIAIDTAVATPAISPIRILSAPQNQTQSATEYERANRLFALPNALTITAKGSIDADLKKWAVTKEQDGTELFSSKSGPETKAAALIKDGLESFTAYTLGKPSKDSSTPPESSSGVVFKNGKIASFTSCEDSGQKDSIGRICVTATAPLCHTLKKGEPLTAEILKDLDYHEMKALAVILTLRGADHQLDNVVRFGNRLGLKSALQTTKGQLVTLARQVSAETTRVPASNLPDPKTAQAVLEKSLPRLKQACIDTGFNQY